MATSRRADSFLGLRPVMPAEGRGRRGYKPALTPEPVKELIHRMWRVVLSADRIWSELVDNHCAASSTNILTIHLRALRHGSVWRVIARVRQRRR
jgi:hypothetical protein